MKNKNILLTIMIGFAVGATGTQNVIAQESYDKQEQTAKPYLEEVIVTANKREQSLNDVGLAIAVISGSEFQNRRISSLADIANSIPSLTFTNSTNNTPVYTLRGVGFYEVSLGAYPTVSVYTDEIPLSFPVLAAHSAYDLERVEVLKGPQGTLFGQNATGGAINYVMAKPTEEFEAGVNISYGRFNEFIQEGYIGGPLSDSLNARLSIRSEQADGWQKSNTRSNDTNGELENIMARLQFAFEPADSLRFLLNINGWQDKSDTLASQYIGLLPQNPILSPDIVAANFSPKTPRSADWTPGYTFADNSMWQTSLRSEFDLADTITLTLLTAYVDYEMRQAVDQDGVPATGIDLSSNSGTIKSFSQEIRLSGDSGDSLRWVMGGNYERSEVDEFDSADISDTSANATLGTLGYPISSPSYFGLQKMTNYAFFGNIEYDISNTLLVKGGIRYTKAEIEAESCNRDLSGLSGDAGPFFYDVLLGGAFGAYQTGDCFAINLLGNAVGDVLSGSPGKYVASLDEDNVSWRVGLDWKPNAETLIYGNLAKGYKAGSYPTLAAFRFNQYLPVTQESVQSYELGFKASLLERALQFNAAAFYYDYTDKQLRSKFNAGPFGILDVLQNVPKSTIKGFELEFVAQPFTSLAISAAFTYVDAKIDEFVGINAAGVASDFGDTDIPFTPKYQIATNVDYEFPINDTLDAFVGTSITYSSDTVSVIGGEFTPPTLTASSVSGASLFSIDDYVLVDLRAGIQTSGGHWRFSVWGKNVFETYSWSNAVAVFDTVVRSANQPATYGISLTFQY